MSKFIQNHPPFLGREEKKFIQLCIKKNQIATYGEYISKFENKILNITKSSYGTSVINGTSAIHLALISLGVGFDDEVMVPSFTFIGTCNPVLHVKASPIFFDVDKYHNINQEQVVDFLMKNTVQKGKYCINKLTKKKIKAIIIVHMWGNAAELRNILSLCKKKNIKVIEDAAESLGTTYNSGVYKNRHVGTIGDIGCISFNSNKIITSAGGGMVVSNSKKLIQIIKYLKNQGRGSNKKYEHNFIGYNYNLSNIHSAIGYAQIKKIKEKKQFKKKLYISYCKLFKNNKNFKILNTPNYSYNNHWMNILKIINKKIKIKTMIDFFKKNNIELREVWKPCHLQKNHRYFQKLKLKNTIEIYNKCICLPSGYNMNKNNFIKLKKIFTKYENMLNYK
tara:strand:- start:7599 stop:8777 length:1179 start_codon:yes stop_codon:yes gene_type:complete